MNFLEGLVKGFTEKRQEVALPELPVASKSDIEDYVDDEHLPVTVKKSESEPIRTISNTLDFLGYVVEETVEWIEREAGEGQRPAERAKKAIVLQVAQLPAKQWKTTRYVVTAGTVLPVAHERDDRRMLRIVNWGPDIVYLAHDVFPTAEIPGPNSLTVPVSTPLDYWPVELPTSDEVWAGVAVGDTATLEVADFYGSPS